MQAVEIKRFAVNRIGIAAVAIGTLALGVLGASMVYDAIQEDSEQGAVAVAQSTRRTDQVELIRFLEQNNFTYADRKAVAPGLLERHGWTGSGSADATSVEQIRFLEQNVWDYAERAQLAGQPEAPPKPQDYRFLEQNIWGSLSLLPDGESGQSY